jgi:hypothetical protein
MPSLFLPFSIFFSSTKADLYMPANASISA